MANALTRNLTPARRPVTPRVDVFEGADDLLLVAELPGVVADAVDVQIQDDRLTLSARRGTPPQGDELVGELPHCDYQRVFQLNVDVDPDKVTASLRNGLLELRLPKAPRARARRIEVHA